MRKFGSTTGALGGAGYLDQLSKDNRKDQKYLILIKANIKADAPELFKVRNLPAKFELTQFYPSKLEIHSQQAFGKNNSSKLYNVVPILTQIAVIMWKLEYLAADHDKPAILAKTLPFCETTNFILQNLQLVDFCALRLLILNHGTYNSPEGGKRYSQIR